MALLRPGPEIPGSQNLKSWEFSQMMASDSGFHGLPS